MLDWQSFAQCFAPTTCTRRNLGQISSDDQAKEDVDLTSWIQLIEHWATNILIGLKRQLDLEALAVLTCLTVTDFAASYLGLGDVRLLLSRCRWL